jgi:CIC family chloride channel protein
MVRRAMLGSEPIFAVPQYTFDHLSDLAYYAVLGVVSGGASGAFTQLLLKLRAVLGRVRRGPHIDLVSTGGAFAAGALGLLAPHMLGIGYSSVNEALNGNLLFSTLLLLAVLKLLGTAIAFSSGNSGGLFAPTLFIGAMFGGAVGSVFIHAGKHAPAHIGAFAIVGMGAVFAGVTRSPITSIFMIFELTQDYAIMLPVMVTISISFAVARLIQRHALFELLAQQDGVYLPHKGEARESALQIADAMRPVSYLITAQQDVATALDKLRQANARAAVIAKEGRLAGVITESLLVAAEPRETVADHLASGAGYAVYPDQPISFALRKLGAGAFILPVVSRIDPGLLLGTLTTADVLSAYGIERSYAQPQPTSRVRPELREAT